jgi:hypothetical protein
VFPTLEESGLELLRAMLQYDPARRISVSADMTRSAVTARAHRIMLRRLAAILLLSGIHDRSIIVNYTITLHNHMLLSCVWPGFFAETSAAFCCRAACCRPRRR